ncbi:MAG: TetR/AcrR family transcriptional regulator [Candidatus Limivicinus sp.]|jgi:AcrR family transcriptional regulator
MSNFTEEAICRAFMSLLNEKPISKITVNDIANRCGINRNSFYYHFSNIPSLVEAIFEYIINQIIEKHPSIHNVEECVLMIADFFLDNRQAVLHIYCSANRSAFEAYLWKMCNREINIYMDTAFNEAGLSQKNRDSVVLYYQCAVFGVVLGWLQDGMKDDIHPFISRICKLRSGFSEKMIGRCLEEQNKEEENSYCFQE